MEQGLYDYKLNNSACSVFACGVAVSVGRSELPHTLLQVVGGGKGRQEQLYNWLSYHCDARSHEGDES